jgi:hypothetical protein
MVPWFTGDLKSVMASRGGVQGTSLMVPATSANGSTGAGSDWFGPGLAPAPTAPPEVAGRVLDYPNTVNMVQRPRGYEPVSFDILRALAQNYDILRLVIETRKDQVAGLNWTVSPKDKSLKIEGQVATRVQALIDFLSEPYPGLEWADWIRLVLEDLFVLDAPAIYRRLNKGGGIYGLRPIDGATIKRVVDNWGDRPLPPFAAYQQILKGMAAVNYTSEELIYRPRNPRTNKLYGFGPVEQIITIINIGLRRETWQLEFFTSGSIPDALIGTPNEWCYSEDTEVLTKRGWLRFGDVDHTTDEFATRNPAGDFEWQRATGINISHFKGDMVSIKSRTIDCLVNPPHRVLVARKRKNGSYAERIRLAGELLTAPSQNDRIPVASNWAGTLVGERVFHNTDPSGGGRDVTMTGDQFCAFMGAYLAEGSTNDRSVMLTQRRDGRGFTAYHDLLAAILGRDPSYHRDSLVIGSAPLARYLHQFGTAREKFIPDEVMNAPVDQIETFLRFFTLGDGSADGRQLHTSSRKMADQLQELVQKAGRSATIGTLDRTERVTSIGNRPVRASGLQYVVGVSASPVRRFTATVEHYDGPIGCVSVPNGILYVRRNGKPCWSGNTPDQLRSFQDWFDARLQGNTGNRRGATFVPGDVAKGYVATKETELFGKAEEWLARVICYAFSISPQSFTMMMNRATAQTAVESATQEGLIPIQRWVKSLMDYILKATLGCGDLEFDWVANADLDPAVQDVILTNDVKTSVITINEARDAKGLDRDPAPEADMLLTWTASGFVPLSFDEQMKQSKAKQDAMPAPVAAPVAALPAPDGGKPPKDEGKAPPAPAKAHTHAHTPARWPNFAAKGELGANRPLARRAAVKMAKAIAEGFSSTADDVAAQVEAILKPLRANKVETGDGDHTDENAAAMTAVDDAKAIDAQAIADGLDLSSLNVIVDAVQAGIYDVASDTAVKALAQVGVKETNSLVDQVNTDAVEFSRERAAELVGKRILADGSIVDNPNAKWAIDETTRTMIRDTIAQGLADNIGTPAIADAIQASYAFSPERAGIVARTEVRNANEQTKISSWRTAGDVGVVIKKTWQTSNNENTCDICEGNEADGEIDLDEDFSSGDDAAPAHPNCLPGQAYVAAEGVVAATKRWFEGDLVVVSTTSGKQISCTPNHPILTARGWVAAGLINKLDRVVSSLDPEWESLGDDQGDNGPARIEDVTEAFGRSSGVLAAEVPTAAPHFHGDGEGSKVAIIWAYRGLRDDLHASADKHIAEAPLKIGEPSGALDASGPSRQVVGGAFTAPNGVVSGDGLGSALFGGELASANKTGLGHGSDNHAALLKSASNDVPADRKALGDGLLGLAGNVAFDDVVDVQVVKYAGDVFNLQTERGWYIAQGVVTSNCECVIVPVVVSDDQAGADSADEE